MVNSIPVVDIPVFKISVFSHRIIDHQIIYYQIVDHQIIDHQIIDHQIIDHPIRSDYRVVAELVSKSPTLPAGVREGDLSSCRHGAGHQLQAGDRRTHPHTGPIFAFLSKFDVREKKLFRLLFCRRLL
jgi:hypothetical protein